MCQRRRICVLCLLLILVSVACARGGAEPTPTPTQSVARAVETRPGATETPAPRPTDTSEAVLPTATQPAPTATAVPPQASPTSSAPRADWTFLVYMASDNNLELQGLMDINEMEAAGSAKAVNVLVQVDRIPGETSQSGDWTSTRRYEVQADDGDLEDIGAVMVSDLGEVNMGDPDALADFIVWGVTNYPARQYALVLWNHGAGWLGVAFDDTTPGYDELSMKELSTGLARALDKVGLDKLDIIGFDACLMGQIDVFQAIQPYARYGVGSEELVPGLGWDYEALLANLYQSPDMPAVRLARHMVFDYLEYYTLVQPDDFVTMSAVDLEAWPQLAAATEALAQAILADPVLLASAVGDARAGAERYASYYPEDEDFYAAVDLWHFASILRERSPDEGVAAAAAAVMEAVETVTIAERHGAGFQQSRGISIYFPRLPGYLSPEYAGETPLLRWTQFLDAYHGAGLAEIPTPTFSIVSVLAETAGYQDPGYLEVEITGRDIESVYLMAGRTEADGRTRLLEYDYLIPEPTILADGTALYEWRDGIHEDFFVWYTDLPYLTDGVNGDYAVMWPTNYDSTLYVIQGRYLPAGTGKAVDVNLVIDTETGRMDSLWGFQGGADGAPYEILAQPGDGFQIYNLYLDEAEITSRQVGTQLTFDAEGSLTYTFLPAPSGDYFLGFSAETIAGQSAEAYQTFRVDNSALQPELAAYLDPYYGFEFLYPDAWYRPIYDGAQLYTSDIPGETWLQVTTYSGEEGPATARDLVDQTLEDFGDVTVLLEQDVVVAGEQGLLTAYGYDDTSGTSHTGVFFAFRHGSLGIVVDVDAPQQLEQNTLEAVATIIDSWSFAPVAFGSASGNWQSLETSAFTVAQPEDFTYQALDGGWYRFGAPDGVSFLAFRTDPDTGTGRLAALERWLDVAGEGVDSYIVSDYYRYTLAGQLWVRADFEYQDEDGTLIWGYVMVTITDGKEVVAWAEAPADTFDAIEAQAFQVILSDLVVTP